MRDKPANLVHVVTSHSPSSLRNLGGADKSIWVWFLVRSVNEWRYCQVPCYQMRRLKRYKLPLCFVITSLLIVSLLCLVEITKRERARDFIDQTKNNAIIQRLSSNFKLLKSGEVQTPHSLGHLNKRMTSLGNSCSQVLIQYNISSHRFVIPLSAVVVSHNICYTSTELATYRFIFY